MSKNKKGKTKPGADPKVKSNKPPRSKRRKDNDCVTLCRALRSTGFKYPDACSEKTIATCIRTVGTISTNSNGRAAFAFAPGKMVSSIAHGTYVADSTATSAWTTSHSATFDSINGSMQNYRVVGAYLRAYYIHSSLENQGAIHFKSDSASTSNWPGIDNPNSFQSIAPVSKHGSITSGCYIMGTPSDTEAYGFYKPSDNTIENTRSWGCHYIFVEGAAADAAVLQYELVQFLEMKPDSRNFIARMATKPAEDNPSLRGRLNSAYSKFSGERTETGLGSWEDFLESVLKNAPAAVRAGRTAMSIMADMDNSLRLEL